MKIVIADDEPMSIAGLETILKRIYGDDLLLYYSSNGQKLIEVVQKEAIELAFIDIRMPIMDGIMALSIIREIKPNVQCIMLSGYAEFDYARQAMMHGAIDYLLKPVGEQSLISALKRANKYLSKQKTDKNAYFASDILYQLSNRTQSENDGESEYSYLLYQFYSDDIQNEAEHLRECMSLCDNFFSNENESFVICSPFNHSACLFLKLKHEETQKYSSFIENLASEQELHAYTIHMETLYDIVEVAYYIEEISSCRILSWRKRILSVPIYAIDEKTVEAANDLVEMQSAIDHKNYHQSKVCWSRVKELSDNLQWNQLQCLNLADYLGYPNMAKSVAEILDLLQREMQSIVANKTSNEKLVERAIKYIESHFCENIGVEEIAYAADVTPNYLSSVFRKAAGIRMNEYITLLRIEEAKKLFVQEQHPKISTVAEKVGFTSSRYFSQVFSSIVGMRPSEYIEFTNSQNRQ